MHPPTTNWIEGLVGARDGLDILEKRNLMSLPVFVLWIVHPVPSSLCYHTIRPPMCICCMGQYRLSECHVLNMLDYSCRTDWNFPALWVEYLVWRTTCCISGRYQAGVCSMDGLVFAAGGCDAWNCLSSVEVYDPQTDEWTYAKGMITARRGCGLAVFKGSLLLYVT